VEATKTESITPTLFDMMRVVVLNALMNFVTMYEQETHIAEQLLF